MPFDKPLQRTRETSTCAARCGRASRSPTRARPSAAPARDKGTGLGKPLKFMNQPLRQDIPVWIAAIGPKNVELAAEVAQGWQPIHFVPDRFQQVWGDALARPARPSARPSWARSQIMAGGTVALGDGPEVREAREAHPRPHRLLRGRHGGQEKNFYNELFQRYGWVDEAEKIQDLFLSGKRDEATAAVPDEYLDLATLCGLSPMCRSALEVYNEVGVTYLNIEPQGDDKLGTIEQIKAWVE